jgi:hypothetical protein
MLNLNIKHVLKLQSGLVCLGFFYIQNLVRDRFLAVLEFPVGFENLKKGAKNKKNHVRCFYRRKILKCCTIYAHHAFHIPSGPSFQYQVRNCHIA